MCILNTKYKKILDDYIASIGFSSYETEISNGGLGKNNIGLVYKVLVSGIKSNKKCTLNLYLKTEDDYPERIKQQNLNIKYEREAFMYNCVINKFREMQRHLKPDEQMTIPICHKATDEYIIMDDYAVKGYSPFKDDNILDYTHTVLMISELARFHAFSFAMRQNNRKQFYEIAEQLTDIVYLKDFFKDVLQLVLQMALDDLDNDIVKGKLEVIGTNLLDKLRDLSKQTDDTKKYSVICHTDSTIRNILFKYNDKGLPIDAVLLDYQFSKFGCPVNDIYFTLISSARADMWDKLDDLTEIYYNSLSRFLAKLGHDVLECYPRNIFENDLLKFRSFAVGASLTVLRIFAIPRRTTEEIKEIFENQDEKKTYFHFDSIEAKKQYKTNINDFMNKFAEIGYI